MVVIMNESQNSKKIEKIALFYSNLVAPGGAERLLLEEEKFFRDKGIETIVLTFSLNKKALFDYQPQQIKVIESKSSYISRIFALRQELQQLKPDLVIAQSHIECIYLYFATLFSRIPYIAHIHGTLFWFHEDLLKYALIHKRVFSEIRESLIGHKEFIKERPDCGPLIRLVNEVLAIADYLAVRKAKKLIVLTDQIKWEVKKLYKKDAIVSRGCLKPEYLHYKPKKDIKQILELQNKKIIFSVGRLDPRKRIDVLIKAFAKISSKYPDIYLLIGGTGEEEGKLKKLAKELNIESRVKFLGFIPDSELFDYYAACDIFVFPSWTTSGITTYEALAVGKKVVWTSEADEPILKDEHVFVVDPTIEDFARGIEKAINTSLENKPDLANYTWKKYFETVYQVAAKSVS